MEVDTLEQIIPIAIKHIMSKDSIFLGLFLVGYYLQYKDKIEQKEFITKQQDVLVDMSSSMKEITGTLEKQGDRLDRIENRLWNTTK